MLSKSFGGRVKDTSAAGIAESINDGPYRN